MSFVCQNSIDNITGQDQHYVPEPKTKLHPSFAQPLLKKWNTEFSVQAENICYPIFVCDGQDIKNEIASLPGQYRLSVDRIADVLDPLVALGLQSVIVFPVVTNPELKSNTADIALTLENPGTRALMLLKEKYPTLLRVVDLCLCGYTDHGHCGVLNEQCAIQNQPSIQQIANIAVEFARAGANVIAPSDMMDGRIGSIKAALNSNGFGSAVSVMAYSAKFASVFYGPFRDAASSGAKFGDRSCYQLPPGSRGLAIRAIQRDIDEGADFVMVKPGMPYLDIVRDCSNIASARGIPVAVYHVSGEYAMLYHGAKAGAFDLTSAVMESMLSMRRAGATILITYFAKELLTALQPSL